MHSIHDLYILFSGNNEDACIVVLGGSTNASGYVKSVELYHPYNKPCPSPTIRFGNNQIKYEALSFGSGCYLPEKNDLVLREQKFDVTSPSVVYNLNTSVARELPLPVR